MVTLQMFILGNPLEKYLVTNLFKLQTNNPAAQEYRSLNDKLHDVITYRQRLKSSLSKFTCLKSKKEKHLLNSGLNRINKELDI